MKGIFISLLLCQIFTVVSIKGYAQHLQDHEIKNNVATIQDPLEKLMALQPKTFTYQKANYSFLPGSNGVQFGFEAEEIKKIFPELVYTTKGNYSTGKNTYRTASYYTIQSEGLIPVLVAAVQEQQKEIEFLKNEILTLKEKL